LLLQSLLRYEKARTAWPGPGNTLPAGLSYCRIAYSRLFTFQVETIIFLNYPSEDIRGIERLVKERESFVVILDGDIYSIVQHIAHQSEFRFTALLDRNVYTRITGLLSDVSPPPNGPDFRWAAAILAFCQIADIQIDLASSLQEYAWHHGGVEALRELEKFRIADNSNPQIFINFALGRITQIPREALASPIVPATQPTAEQFEKRTRDFRVNYTFVLKICEIDSQPISQAEKMIRFLDWMYNDFFFGAPALLFASRYFSPNRHKRMIKSTAKRHIENAAWDLALVQEWRRRALKGMGNNEPVLLISGDKAVKDMARRMVADTEEQAVDAMREVWGKSTAYGKRIWEHYSRLWQAVSGNDTRRPPDHNRQMAMIAELEEVVFGPDATTREP
jgi:nicotinamide mononucleotide adenylyltransferase